MVVRHLL